MAFTRGYAVNPPALVFHADRKELRGLEDLKGLKLAVPPATSFDHLIKERHPDIIRVPVDGALKGMEAVSFGQADAFIESLSVVTALLEENLLSNLRVVGVEGLQKEGENDLRMAVKKGDEILRDILEKGLEAVDRETRSALFKTHFAANRELFEVAASGSLKIPLTGEEQAWINDHPVIRMATDDSWPPFEFRDEDGAYAGLTAGYVEAVAKRLGVEMKPSKGIPWTEGYEMATEASSTSCLASSPRRNGSSTSCSPSHTSPSP